MAAIRDPFKARGIPGITGFNDEDENIFMAPQTAPVGGVAQRNASRTFKQQPVGSVASNTKAKNALVKGADNIPTNPDNSDNSETRDFGITALIVGLVGLGVSAAGAASSAKAQDEALAEQKRQAGIQQGNIERSQEEEERLGRLRGLESLADKRVKAQQSANLRHFSKGLIARVGQAQNQRRPGLGVSTVGGK